MKTRSQDSGSQNAEQVDSKEDVQTQVAADEDTKPSGDQGKKRKQHEHNEQDDDDKTGISTDKKQVKEEDEKKSDTQKAGSGSSSRKKPRTEGVAEPGELPPDAFGGGAKMTDKDAERRHGVIEHGKIYFLYRPRVEVETVDAVEYIAQ